MKLHGNKFRENQLSAAMALALGLAVVSGSAFAAGMPGLGTVTVGTVTANSLGIPGGGAGAAITGLASGNTLTVTGASVVQWGGRTDGTVDTNPAGFNLSTGSILNVHSKGFGATALLNVDASGNPSVIAGKLLSTNPFFGSTRIFIANANGITVTPTGTIAAPYVGLIGANLAVGNVAGVPTAAPGTAQAIFGTGGNMPITYANANGNVTVEGTIEGSFPIFPVNPTGGLLIAGSGSVNVDFTNIQAANQSAFVSGGSSLAVNQAGAVNYGGTKSGDGNAITGVVGYVATNVALNNATAALAQVDAYGNLAFSGNSVLPNTPFFHYQWKGVLSNTGNLQLMSNSIEGATGGGATNYWFDTPNPTGTGFVRGPVGSIVNSGTITSGGVGLTTVSNGFTNTGTLNLQSGITNALSITSGTGDVNLGGVVQATNTQAAIERAKLTAGIGNINVSTPLTIGNSGASNGASFTALATTGNVNITGAMTVANSEPSSTGITRYRVTGNNITIGANQTVTNINGTTSKQPRARLILNGTSAPGTVTIGAGNTLTAGDVRVYGAVQSLTNLVADGNITATNTTEAPAGNTDGRFTFIGNNLTGSGAGTITGQVFDLWVTGNVRKSQPNLTNNYWSNGLVLTSAGANPTLNLGVDGNSRQFINLRVDGNITANSATPSGAGFTNPTMSGAFPVGDPNPNRMSQLMLMSTGNLTLAGSGSAYPLGKVPGPQAGYFFFPGLSYFGTIPSLANPNAIGTGSITALGDVNNSLAMPVSGGEGLYFMTNNLNLNGSLFTSMNSWVNYANASQEAAYANVQYAVAEAPVTNTLNMEPAPTIGNVYTIPTFP
ncbi:MAG: hypothetical protein M1492_07785 [Gammaproteobacteria bacterium]|nr:hypothetical protein [Gammaproteobacteria bacterium]